MQERRVLTVFLLGLIVLGTIPAGCDKKETPPPPAGPGGTRPSKPASTPPATGAAPNPAAPSEKKGTVGLSVLTLANPFFKEIADNLKDALAESGYDLVVTDGDFDARKQQTQVENFITQGVRAIVLTPCDSKAVGVAVKRANEAGIPVFTADIACTAEGVDVICHIATDNYGGGKMAARAIVKGLKERGGAKGEIAIIDHDPVESVQLRTKGFLEQLAEENKADDVDLKVVKRLPGGGAAPKSRTSMQAILTAHPQLKAVFAINDPSAFGVVAAIEAGGKGGQVVVVGFDGQPQGKQYIKEGKIYSDPIQFPDRIGKITAKAVTDYLKGKRVAKEILIPTALYFQADAEQDPALK